MYEDGGGGGGGGEFKAGEDHNLLDLAFFSIRP